METTGSGLRQGFLSHCSEDIEYLTRLDDVLNAQYDIKECTFFFSSGVRNSTSFGDPLSPALREALQASDFMIAVISDSYLRSIISIAEISVFWYLKKPVIPIVFDQDGIDFLKELMGAAVIYIDLGTKSPGHIQDCAARMLNTMEKYGFFPKDPESAKKAFYDLFLHWEQAAPARRYIGSGENFANIDQYCEQYGVKLFKNTSLPLGELTKKLAGCRELYILATTGSNLINALSSEFLPAALAEGMDLTVLLPNRWSAYVSDVAEIESPEDPETHKERFVREFDSVVYNLKNCLSRAKAKSPDRCGEIYLGCSHNLIRQTVTLAVWEDRLWGWLSVTIPPKRTVDGTPSLEFSGERGGASIGNLILDHVISIRDLAVRRNTCCRLSQSAGFQAFFLENEGAEAYWRDLYETAKRNSAFREGESELIEVAAQHPLRTNGMPGKEFAKRLDYAAQLYRKLREEGTDVKIYIPGSVHCFKGKADPCSLSAAGTAYLLSQGIPAADLLGEEENARYKGEQGVYNTADECYVASRIFFDGDCCRLHCVCSPNQLLRKKLFYIAFGVIPFYHTVSSDNMAHDDIYELFHSIPEIIASDHTWQGPDSRQGNRTRSERDPRFALEA